MARTQQPLRNTRPANKLVDSLLKLLRERRFEQARERAEALHEKFPRDARIMALRGDALRELEHFDEAVRAYRQALDAGARSSGLRIHLATCLIRDKQPRPALEALEDVLRAHPEHPRALRVQGDAWRHLGEPAKARACYRQALRQRPDDPDLYLAVAHLETFTPDSPVFDVLRKHLGHESLSEKQRASTLAGLGKALLDIGEDEQAFEQYREANRLMDESLPPIKAQLERLLGFTRQYFTPSLFEKLSSAGSAERRQIIIAGMSRAGKSLVESLFRGVAGVRLEGESPALGEQRNAVLEPYRNRTDAWLAGQTPATVARDAQAYRERLGGDGDIRVTTIPGDLWNLGFIGLWAPTTPIIFCVRGMLDLGITGFFQQYQIPKGYRYSYNLHQLGRQIACSEKVMEHWAQVLPNPVYLVDYEALTRDPEQVMGNLLGDLGLVRERDYADIVAANAALVDDISPIVSTDAPMPISDRFNGIGERFRNQLEPMIAGYRSIADAFPRREPPAALPRALPERLREFDEPTEQADEEVDFEWRIDGRVTVLDNGGQLLRHSRLGEFMQLGAFALVAFDPAGDITLTPEQRQEAQLQYVPQVLLGDGQPATIHACLDPARTATLEPLPADPLAGSQRAGTQVLAKLPVATQALDAVDGLEKLDWLVLDGRHDVLAVLEHGERTLANALLLQVGVGFQPLYRRQPSLDEISHWAARHGFRFHRLIQPEHTRATDVRDDLPNPPAGTCLERAAALYVPDRTRMAALADAERLKLAFLLDGMYDILDLSHALLREIGEDLAEHYLRARGCCSTRREGPAASQLAAVQKALETGDVHGTGRQIKAWRARYPADTRVQCLTARYVSSQGRHGQAVHEIRRTIVEQAPEDLSARLTGVDILLGAGMWWEADVMARALQARFPDHDAVRYRAWQALAAQPAPDPTEAEAAQRALAASPPVQDATRMAARLSLEGRLQAHAGHHEQALARHGQAIEMLDSVQGPVRARLLTEQADSLYQAGRVDASCDALWQACDTRPYSIHTVRAYQKLVLRLVEAERGDLAALLPLQRRVREIWGEYGKEELAHTFGDFGLPYQGFEPLKLAGGRPAMARLKVYDLEPYLPDNARALDIGCNHGYLLLGLADRLAYGQGFDISTSCIEVGKAVAGHLGIEHVHLSSQPFDEFVCKKRFDLVIACAVHHWIGVPMEQFGARLAGYCRPGGIVLLESQGRRSITQGEPGFDAKVATIAEAGFDVVREGQLCDDGSNYREFRILRRAGRKGA